MASPKFTVSHASGIQRNATKQLRADLVSRTTLESQKLSVKRASKSRHDRWIRDCEERTFLEAEDAAWCGKALISEAVRYQYAHRSKRLTKTILGLHPLLDQDQKRHEEDVAFALEEHAQQRMVQEALARIESERATAGLPALSEEERTDKTKELDLEIEAPEIDPKTIVAPMAPQLAKALWYDLERALGLSFVDFHQPLRSLGDIKQRYQQSIGAFTQLQLWRVKSSSSAKNQVYRA